MRHKITQLVKHPLISGSTVVLAGSFVANLCHYFFNLSMGRLLTVADYGLLTTLISVVALFGIIPGSFTGIFARFTAKYKVNKDEEGYLSLLFNGGKFIFILSGIVFFILILTLPFIVSFLHINNVLLLVLIFILIVLSILFSLTGGVLQGEMRFFSLSILNMMGPFLKIVLGVGFLLLGLQIFGVVLGILLSSSIAVLISFYLVFKNHYKKTYKKQKDFFKEFRKYGTGFFLSSLGITILSSMDIILVRHFFGAIPSGQYAALSLMGKAIFYLSAPIYFVFFPLIAQKREKKEKLFETVVLAGVVIVLFSSALSFVYFLFPDLILSIFFPAKEYKMLAPYLGIYSLYILIFSLAMLLNNYFLSIGKTEIYKINLGCGVLFIILLSIFHASLFQVIAVLFSVSFLLLLFLSGVMYKELKN
ncbi:MAG: hypothetical protein COX79_00040 [Candidatus Levybacteria bacterium CG_4_10_14_0_2_um_filter_36_16]|nr:MAG: hypothetical protein AUK12_00630 [Candidatus Levybacteria bacterium CG2_30_37_29]PIR78808.1 MAG: hypothetical protein COU26_04600 [Candidatus Levybacteria bacterium CG10_big_fil_rev_8_21_14_0_10_36_30]PIZ98029.1 MAG: hypothetical protein COX79_00040 [Candidatus Levybacteria bacterium CG_4_10_14_0_2_um_filter_36_16]